MAHVVRGVLAVRERMTAERVTLVLTFNFCIEHLWSQLKHNLKRLLMSTAEHIDEPTWRDLVHRAWFSIDPAVFNAMIKSNRAYVSDLLETL